MARRPALSAMQIEYQIITYACTYYKYLIFLDKFRLRDLKAFRKKGWEQEPNAYNFVGVYNPGRCSRLGVRFRMHLKTGFWIRYLHGFFLRMVLL